MKTIDTLLIANRGEIACRVMRTAKALGLTTVAVHSTIDRSARHVREADIAIDLGGAKPGDSYLLMDRIIEAAQASGAQAIHPGYGFLSENATFARKLEAAGLIFLGPPASAIDAMGSKSAAKALMEAAGVPLVPGYHGEAQDLQTFRSAAAGIGYPVLLKATAGGGGKGMKVVESESQLAEALASAQREAQSAFGDGRMLVEKYLLQPRHVEIQVFADQHGNCLYLNERDCSIQRRHQKVVEEAPAPGLSPELRRAMGESAVRAAQAIGYVGAGTVEFLLDARGEFFFMEMNTRLQVEHPVTEAITNLDLVAWQVRVARGEPLPIRQDQVPLVGHAIEVRLYAEDPEGGFLPASGHLDLYREPAAGPGRRVDSGVEQGDDVSPFYDPMLAKLIAWGENREEARQRLLAMLGETVVGGFKTNLAFLQRILANPAFAAAQLDTGFIDRHQAQLLPPVTELPEAFWLQAGAAFLATDGERQRQDDPYSPWASRSAWRSGLPAEVSMALVCGDASHSLVLQTRPASAVRQSQVVRQGDTLYLRWGVEWLAVRRFDPIAAAGAGNAHQGGLTAPMNGSIVRVLVEPGQQVEAGAALVVLEAMKMEHSIRAPQAGTIKAIHCAEGELIGEGAVLVELETQP
ncbi:3-methylcrotonyl-CoA carboxylase alpha subunit [Pseudomonas sp. BIGb0408]|uniref:Biotin carboxylase n=1 Tax=Phytopseudomonas flavescens TaxID=29435 RepID=A0A7Y9XIF9_9GAMM|nr:MULTISPECIES: acetyl/propionyl/methylcrotonyl-CoA carboxylase subunit alpha [Pseudomonas]MCW2293441.1 3-methylcrotonyl-CoA carboxylase alpha subunit [Pseudomonas sp. BIGb0408]NYH71988.1 3-methylcrotonyl-CoA carboxylase alpha subunit [Pseudomonas flavescens]